MNVTRVVVGAPAKRGPDPGPDSLETISITSLAQLREAAARADTPLLWLLDARVVPAPDALEALLDAGTVPAASVPVDSAGAPIEPLLGRFAFDDEALVAGAERRQVPLRYTHVISMLVEREMVLKLIAPDPVRFGVYAGSEWAARLIAWHGGALVATSRVLVTEVPRVAWLPALRVMRAGAWRRRETLRELRRSLPSR